MYTGSEKRVSYVRKKNYRTVKTYKIIRNARPRAKMSYNNVIDIGVLNQNNYINVKRLSDTILK